MDTRKMLQEYVKERTSKQEDFPDVVREGMNTVGGEIPTNLKLAITLSELITFVSHLRKSIKLYDGTLVPVNAIVFALSASGTSKDKSLNAIRKALQEGYDVLEGERIIQAEGKARTRAYAATGSEEDWAKFYSKPKPLQAGLGTVEGLVQHFADIAVDPLGAGSIMTSEIGSELQGNANMPEIIKAISVAYDLGNIPAKIIKSNESQTANIKEFPVSALFFGSQEALLFNNEIKNRFKLAFNTQLARRSLFTYSPEVPRRLQFSSVDELYAYRNKERDSVVESQEAVRVLTNRILEGSSSGPLEVSDEANKLFDVYLEYNVIRSDEMTNRYPIVKLSQRHKQWLALKISGAYALLDSSEVITEAHYATAINTVELLSYDLLNFEKELVKEPYEQLVDMCKYNAEDKSYFISLHDLKKLSYISGSGATKSKVEDLVIMANSYDATGSYTATDTGIDYKEIVKTDIVGVSYILFSADKKDEEFKAYAADKCARGYEFYETEFAELSLLLSENAVYSPFVFKDGIRHKDNVTGGAKFLVLDIDKSFLTKGEAHVLLNEYNHHVTVTSDPENEYKFRVLLEFDSVVEVDDATWKALVSVVGQELGFVVDLLPKSQIFFSFAGREVLSQLRGETLDSKSLIEKAKAIIKDKPKPVSALPPKAKEQRLEDPRETFGFAFTAEQGERSVKLYRALAYAIDLGADEAYLEHLAHEINDYWITPMDNTRLENTLLKPAIRRL